MENFYGETIRIDVKNSELFNPLINSKSCNAIQNCIVDFIKKYNSSKRYTLGGNFSFYIIYHSVHDLYSGNEYKFGQDYLKNENKEKLPIIHLTLFDIFDPPTFPSGNKQIKLPEVKRYNKIVDSSIWNYYFPLFATDPTKKCATIINYERFNDVLQKVANNTSKHLYDLSVADEYADLNARLLEQSYLKGSHKAISPFIFHSENELQTLIREEFEERIGLDNESIVSQIKKHKWRILLVDDKADGGMSNNNNISSVNDCYGLPQNSKLSIIISLLDKLFVDSNHTISYGERVSNSENVLFSIEYAKKVSEAQDKIRNKKYDLILLDYLLEQDEYGYELLEEIWNDQQRHKKDEEHLIYKSIKPHRHLRMYCMFISAYSSAVHDRLLAEGLNQSEDYWFINLGACPTNTPQLFLYNLLKIMDKRLEDSGILKLSSDSIYKLTNKIYRRKEDDPKRESVRKRANAHYQEVLSLQYHYRSILRDVEIPFGDRSSIFDTNGSVLMTDFIQKKINLGGMLEHLTQLVHLTAFGTIRQWPEMWEEYIYFKAMFEKQLDDVSEKEFRDLCSYIEEYILKLKSQQQ